ncbi:hypothetical protein L6452_34310 [Arctium lappa]|uniref:Uncharacterized protein n=1 Tax=Arctium lappa TaxID=4217 RepID=A0ACB8YIK1_ARCLA|nr:hypothetical protein L6452_34310 [Arctium lappa]
MQEAFPSSTMADEEEEDKEERTLFVPPDALIEWERFQLRPIPDQFQFQSQSPSQSPSLSDPIGSGEIWSTIHEDHQPSVVFPPVNHEGIHLHHHQDVREIDVERAVPPSPVSSPRRRPVAMAESVAVRWWDAGMEALRFKFMDIVSFLRSFSMNRGGLLRSHFPLAGSVVLLLLFYLSSRRRRRRRRESIIQLIRIIKEKDEKIHQLLYQIARMNELLLATHHGIPMISKATSA